MWRVEECSGHSIFCWDLGVWSQGRVQGSRFRVGLIASLSRFEVWASSKMRKSPRSLNAPIFGETEYGNLSSHPWEVG